MSYKEMKLKSENKWDELKITLWEDGRAYVSTDHDGFKGIDVKKEVLKDFLTKVLKELDDGVQERVTRINS